MLQVVDESLVSDDETYVIVEKEQHEKYVQSKKHQATPHPKVI